MTACEKFRQYHRDFNYLTIFQRRVTAPNRRECLGCLRLIHTVAPSSSNGAWRCVLASAEMMVNKAPAGCKDLTERAKPLFFDAYICSYDYQTTHASMTPESWLQSHKRTLSKLCNVDLYMDILSYNKKWDKCERLLDRALDDSPLGQHLFEEATTHILAKTVMEAIKTRVNDAFSHESHRTRENNAVLVENVKDEILEIKWIDNLPELILVTITYMDLPVKIPCEGIVSQIETYIEMKQREAGVVAGEVPPLLFDDLLPPGDSVFETSCDDDMWLSASMFRSALAENFKNTTWTCGEDVINTFAGKEEVYVDTDRYCNVDLQVLRALAGAGVPLHIYVPLVL